MIVSSEDERPLVTPPLSGPCGEATSNEPSADAKSETSPGALPIERSSFNSKLPPIPSFSQFVNSRKAKGGQINTTPKHSPRVEKRMRL